MYHSFFPIKSVEFSAGSVRVHTKNVKACIKGTLE